MHELYEAKSLFAEIIKAAAENGFGKIERIKVVLGEASGIDPDFLRHSFIDHLFPGTDAEGAQLEIEVRGVGALCSDCGRSIKDFSAMKCPYCSGTEIELESGREIFVEEIEGSPGAEAKN